MTQTASGYEPVDWQAKWNFEHELVVDQEAEIKRLDAELDSLRFCHGNDASMIVELRKALKDALAHGLIKAGADEQAKVARILELVASLDRHVAIAIAQREQIQALEVMLSRWLDRFSFRGDSAIKLLVDDTRVHLPIPGKADMETTEGLV